MSRVVQLHCSRRLAISIRYGLIPSPEHRSRKVFRCILGEHEPTTILSNRCSRILLRMASCPELLHKYLLVSAHLTKRNCAAVSLTLSTSTVLPMFPPQWQMKTPTLGSSGLNLTSGRVFRASLFCYASHCIYLCGNQKLPLAIAMARRWLDHLAQSCRLPTWFREAS